MVRRCSTCKIEKSLEDFHFKNKKTDKRHYDCKSCQKEKAHNHYLKNKDKYISNTKIRVKKLKNQINNYKSNIKCKECGECHPACLDFHHINFKEKNKGISYLVNNYNINSLKKEIEKCIVLCSNCHRKLHWKERNG